jgi:hypothetical protein
MKKFAMLSNQTDKAMASVGWPLHLALPKNY